MLSISTLNFDLRGSVVLDTNADFMENSARVTRQKTLDGGVYINHSGVSDGDRTFKIKTRVTEDQAGTLWYLFNSHVFVHVSGPAGFFKAVIQDLKINNGDMNCTVLIDTKEA